MFVALFVLFSGCVIQTWDSGLGELCRTDEGSLRVDAGCANWCEGTEFESYCWTAIQGGELIVESHMRSQEPLDCPAETCLELVTECIVPEGAEAIPVTWGGESWASIDDIPSCR